MDLNLFITLCALVISVATPAVVNFQNNKHQLKLRKIDLIYNEKKEAYLKFAEDYGKASINRTDEYISMFLSSASKCYFLCNSNVFFENALKCISILREDSDQNSHTEYFIRCLKILNIELDITDLETFYSDPN